ncbi:hypothetical protein [Paracoccus shandongensis]|uniref:hypothetical protein n=1 Tax=Paracoccus shandongensis TaxID=2816048 RepID=UPI001A8FFCAF|nr:hypothetical protein [Paracoccus shandongensis]
MKKKISRSEALDILASMPLESPGRSELVSIVGYDPNEKWAGPLGEHSFIIAEMMQKKNIKPKL